MVIIYVKKTLGQMCGLNGPNKNAESSKLSLFKDKLKSVKANLVLCVCKSIH